MIAADARVAEVHVEVPVEVPMEGSSNIVESSNEATDLLTTTDATDATDATVAAVSTSDNNTTVFGEPSISSSLLQIIGSALESALSVPSISKEDLCKLQHFFAIVKRELKNKFASPVMDVCFKELTVAAASAVQHIEYESSEDEIVNVVGLLCDSLVDGMRAATTKLEETCVGVVAVGRVVAVDASETITHLTSDATPDVESGVAEIAS